MSTLHILGYALTAVVAAVLLRLQVCTHTITAGMSTLHILDDALTAVFAAVLLATAALFG
jgi:hypothetical protein